jgi:hypothetical protein
VDTPASEPVSPTSRLVALRPVAEALPTGVVVTLATLEAWAGGSIASGDWLGYAILAALTLAVVLAFRLGTQPSRTAAAALAGLLGLAAWDALSIVWSPVPPLARDEALLVVYYVIAFAVPLLSLRTETSRVAAVGAVVLGTLALAIAIAVRLLVAADPNNFYDTGRLGAPIGYVNAQATVFVLTFWPAIALAARRSVPVLLRACAAAAAAAGLAGFLATQSKGAAVALAVASIVYLSIAKNRLRALVPALLAGAVTAPAFWRLTDPFRAHPRAIDGAIRSSAWTILLVTLAAGSAGLVYALLDRRVAVDPKVARFAGIGLLAALAAGVAAGLALFVVSEPHPGRFFQKTWRTFKQPPVVETGTSHFGTIGSYRYDMWRVAWNEGVAHPVAGIGARAFGTVYLQKESINRSPQRSHSLELDVFSETGIVGLVLFVVGLGAAFAGVAARARSSPIATACLAAGAGWLAHASVDWTWTVPPAGLPFVALLGAGAALPRARALAGRFAWPAAGLVAVVVVLCFVPPWLSARYVNLAYGGSRDWEHDIDRARSLDPISVDPLIARALLTRDDGEAVAALGSAADLEPRSAQVWYLLGKAELRMHRRVQAVAALRRAHALAPFDFYIRTELDRALNR